MDLDDSSIFRLLAKLSPIFLSYRRSPPSFDADGLLSEEIFRQLIAGWLLLQAWTSPFLHLIAKTLFSLPFGI